MRKGILADVIKWIKFVIQTKTVNLFIMNICRSGRPAEGSTYVIQRLKLIYRRNQVLLTLKDGKVRLEIWLIC